MDNLDYISIRKDIDNLSNKMDDLSVTITEIKSILAETRGANIPARVTLMEGRVNDIEKYNASQLPVLKIVEQNNQDIKDIKSFQYKAVGVLSVLSLVFTAIGKFIMDKIFH